jgi:hypothetical protein
MKIEVGTKGKNGQGDTVMIVHRSNGWNHSR